MLTELSKIDLIQMIGGTVKKDTKVKLIFLITTILMCTYLIWRVFFTLPLQEGLWEIIFGVLLVGSEIITTLTTFELFIEK